MLSFSRKADRARNRDRDRDRKCLDLEALEGRQLLSLGSEFAGTINTTTRNGQFGAANAVTTFDAGSRSGGSVSIDSFGHYLLTDTSPDLDIHGRHGSLSS